MIGQSVNDWKQFCLFMLWCPRALTGIKIECVEVLLRMFDKHNYGTLLCLKSYKKDQDIIMNLIVH